MQEKKGVVSFQGKPLTLTGHTVKAWDTMPDAALIDNETNPIQLSSFKGKVMIILSVPSLDTPVCSRESHRFDSEIVSLGNDLVTLVVSNDLPFAQKRWATSMNTKNIKIFSDFKDHEFAQKFGVYIKETGLLARAVFVVDQKGVVRYFYIVKDLSQEPPYEEILNLAKQLVNEKASSV